MEDVRMSNFAYTQTIIAGYMSFYFSLIGIGSSIVASEINRYYNLNDLNKDEVISLFIICNVSTFFLIIAIIIDYVLNLQWKKTKL